MKNALLKDTFREIKGSFSRFLSIFLIVALGVAFFAGIKATSPDMKITADKYFDDYKLMDIRLLSTLGFTDKDVEALKDVDKVEGIFPTYSMDTLVKVEDRELVVKAIGMPLDKINSNDSSYINRTRLIEGRYPESSNECLVEKGRILTANIKMGEKINLYSGTEKPIDDSLKTSEFTIVGVVETPYYITFERGTTSIGNGKVNSFVMIPQEAFKIPAYTEVFLTVEDTSKLQTYDDEYMEIIKPVKEKLEALGKDRAALRYEDITSEARKELDKSKKELQEGEEKQKSELLAAYNKLQDGKRKVEEGEVSLKNEIAKFNKTIKSGEEELAKGYKNLAEGERQYKEQLQAFSEGKAIAEREFPLAEEKLKKAEGEIKVNEAKINQLKFLLNSGAILEGNKKEVEAEILAGEKALSEAKVQLEQGKKELQAKRIELSQGEIKLAEGRKTLDASKIKLDSENKKLQQGKKTAQNEFAAARKKLEDSKVELQKGQEEYEKGKRESDNKIAEGYEKIAKAEKEINDIKKPQWYILDRNTNLGFAEYESAADRIDAISQVFPVFFFLIAALVCLTTMTRMVDDDRIHIGTLKALGYGKLAIASKYLIYAITASLGGSILGFLVGFKVFPTVIFNAYRIMYTLPDVMTEFNVTYAVVATLFAVLTTTTATWMACYKELKVEPASLMRPKAPKAGKRIFLERLTFIWSRLNFTQKVTARNLVRYKKRFFMTVLGIGGCTALLLAGFGLKDSIIGIATKQFDELYQYDMSLELKEEVESSQAKNFGDEALNNPKISEFMFIREDNVDVGKDGTEKAATLIVPENFEDMKAFVKLRNRVDKSDIPFNEDSVVINEKLSKLLNVKVGDEIYIKRGETEKVNVKVSGITENYVFHYIYMSPKVYEQLYGEKLKFKQVLGKITDTSEVVQSDLSTELLKNDKITSVGFITNTSKNFEETIGSLNYVVLVLIISAGALAFVVLYNLTNINVTERLREIATIKVLGFYDREVSSYVYRENIILTLIGTSFGLLLGILFHRFIVSTAEIEFMMFGRTIKGLSYVYSAILTLIFSGLVNFVMYFKLKTIDMIESLKSVD
ncbi:putative ABC transport system permease protein [Clostridium punense]|uniref:ABC transport system permease protein n=1 Tax=Clostridium punense TaxID=1054297 RepID=A0ABS4K6T9_9CLOT|nr:MULTISPECIES: FtsX-like permease family protein [Clostridium]EQB87344.1 hypothetical protein M918_09605 [Clostridium sp. BL8]MBP2023495.1 putative ABC transport system permease protein [Clostridium punense]